jgi:glycosyltransferase involved in cell wall biosynthesis
MDNKPIYLYVTPFFPSALHWQGGFCYDAVRALIHDARYDVRILLTGSSDHDYDYHDVRVHCVRRLKFPLDCAPFFLVRLNGWLFKRKLRKLGIDIGRVSVCHSNVNPEYSFVVKRENPKAKVLWQTHRMGAPFSISVYRLGIVLGLSDLLYLYWRKMLEAMDVVVVLSRLHVTQFGKAYPDGPLGRVIDMRQQTLFRCYRRIEPKKVCVLYNGIDTSIFNNYGRPEHIGFVIGCVGNFGATKGQDTLIRAFNLIKPSLPEARLVFIGSGPRLLQCQALVKELGLEKDVVFEIECDHLKLADWYKSFDLFILPTYNEGFCCVLVEAVGCGTPSMTTDMISFREVVPKEDHAKWLFRPDDANQLASKIIDYHKNRFVFRFNCSMDINDLWRRFLDEI